MAVEECLLVTGATGRIGAFLRAAWSRRPPEFKLLWQSRHADAPDGWLRWDIASEPLPPWVRADAVLHLAGPTPATGGDPQVITGLAEAAQKAAVLCGARRLFLASSAAVHGRDDADWLDDDAVPAPVSAYGMAKAAMERAALAQTGLPVTILRIGNVVGAGALLGACRPCGPVELDVVAGQPDGPVRSWIGPGVLADALAGLVAAALRGEALPGCLNVAQSPPLPMGGLLDAAGFRWARGPANPLALARVALRTDRLAGLVGGRLPAATPGGLVADWRMMAPVPA